MTNTSQDDLKKAPMGFYNELYQMSEQEVESSMYSEEADELTK